MPLEGKTAVVTGGGRGIGRAFCERLAADGANVVVVDLNDPAAVVDALPGCGKKAGMVCDVSDPEQVKSVAATVIERFRRCDILVSNAAMLPVSDLGTLTSDLWRRVQATNVEPLLHFAQAFAPGMAAAGWGRIVTTGSSSTLHPQAHDLVYMTSKGGVHALTRSLANELGDDGITVNSIAPTVVMTEGYAERMPAGGPTANDMMRTIVSQQTIKRACTPVDVANLLGFLVSDQAGFITGQIIHVDGGRTRSGA